MRNSSVSETDEIKGRRGVKTVDGELGEEEEEEEGEEEEQQQESDGEMEEAGGRDE